MVESWSSTSTSTSTSTAFLFPCRLCRAYCTDGCHQRVNNLSTQKQQPSALDSSSSCHRRIDIVRSKVSFPTVLAAHAGIDSDGTTTDDEDHPRTDDDNTIDRSEVNDSDKNTTNDDQDQEEEEEEEYMEIESLSSDQILELIELSFFQACFALSKGDSEPLKLFIVAVKTAAKKFEKASAMAITQTVNSLPSSIGRPLEEQEQELRDTWIQAIYLLLGHTLALGDDDDFVVVNDRTTNNNDKKSVADLYGPILDDLVAIHNTGMGLNVNQFISTRKDILMPPKKKKNNNNNPLMLEENDENDDLVQLAVVTQTVKLLYTTLEVLEGEGSDKYSYAVEEDGDEPASSSSSSTSTGRGFG